MGLVLGAMAGIVLLRRYCCRTYVGYSPGVAKSLRMYPSPLLQSKTIEKLVHVNRRVQFPFLFRLGSTRPNRVSFANSADHDHRAGQLPHPKFKQMAILKREHKYFFVYSYDEPCFPLPHPPRIRQTLDVVDAGLACAVMD